MHDLEIDLECYSEADLKKTGVYPYAAHPSFEILLFGYSVDEGPVEVVDLANGEVLPDEILDALTDKSITKWAQNCSFERVCLSAWLKKNYPERFVGYGVPDVSVGDYLDPVSWRCTMTWGAYMGLPLSLKGVGAVLQLEDQKMSEGEDLIRYFCKPCLPTKSNGSRTRNMPWHAPEKWELFKAYNKRDVEVEVAIKQRLSKFPVPESVWEEYTLGQKINDRGIRIDMQLAENAIRIDAETKQKLLSEIQTRTGLENPNSVSQMKGWLSDKGIETESLDKKAVKELLPDAQHDVAEVLSCRQQLAKSSVSKYAAMQNAACADGRARGMFVFYGANRTGRWAGRNVMLHNLPQNHMPDLAEARALVRDGNFAALEMLYDNVPQVLSELIRTAFIPKPGYKFIVADFSAIEARVLSFLAGEQWRLDMFANGGDIYCQSASQMFKVPVVKNGENGHLRQRGKVAELACIAEGSPVLTDRGLVPIQDVTTDMKVWDGENWVAHDGVVCRGEKEVITYEGLTATPDHLVFIEGQPEPVEFKLAAICRAHLVHPVKSREVSFDRGASRVYDIRNAGPNHRFTVSNCLVHNCGYGGATGALKAMGAMEMGVKEDELQPLVDAWREANPNIVRLWWDMDRAVKAAVRDHTATTVSMFKVYCQSGMLFIDLPSGRRLAYVKPRMGTNRFGSECVTYEGTNTGKWARIESYGPKFIENCLAGATLVLTTRGLVPIKNVLRNDLIWDGLEWVTHEGVIDKGTQETVRVGKLRMTPEHKILTEKGWYACGEAEGLNWASVQCPGSSSAASADRITVHKAGLSEQVYDLRNCGPRHRFTVLDGTRLRIVSNCTQAVARDILAYAMRTLSDHFIVGHVHDELIIECKADGSIQEICEQMGRTPPWIEGLPLRADGYECGFYMKS